MRGIKAHQLIYKIVYLHSMKFPGFEPRYRLLLYSTACSISRTSLSSFRWLLSAGLAAAGAGGNLIGKNRAALDRFVFCRA